MESSLFLYRHAVTPARPPHPLSLSVPTGALLFLASFLRRPVGCGDGQGYNGIAALPFFDAIDPSEVSANVRFSCTFVDMILL